MSDDDFTPKHDDPRVRALALHLESNRDDCFGWANLKEREQRRFIQTAEEYVRLIDRHDPLRIGLTALMKDSQ